MSLNQQQVMQVLVKLGFLRRDRAPAAFEDVLLNDLWALLKGEENSGVTFDTLKVILLNLIGLRTKDREIQIGGDKEYASVKFESKNAALNESTNQAADVSVNPNDASNENTTSHNTSKMTSPPAPDQSIIGLFKGSKFYLRKGDHKKVFTHFKAFYVHRVQFVGLDQEYRQSLFDSYDPQSEIKKKPEISEKTAKLAEAKRMKLFGAANLASVSKVEIFLQPKTSQAKIEAKQKAQIERELEDCTFSPQTLNYNSLAQKSQLTHGDKCKDLYAKKIKGWFVEKIERTTEQYEYDRNKDDLTFTPEINDPVKVSKLWRNFEERKIDQIKGMDKVRDRMERARI